MKHWLRTRVQRWLELDAIPRQIAALDRRHGERLTAIRQELAQIVAEVKKQKRQASPLAAPWDDIDPHLGQN